MREVCFKKRELASNRPPPITIAAIGLLVLLLLPPIIARAATQKISTPTQVSLPPGVEIKVEAKPQKATVGDLINIDIDAVMPSGCRIELPKFAGQVGDFSILDFLPGPVIPEINRDSQPTQSESNQDGGRVRHQARIVAAIYKTGKFDFPPIQMTLWTAEEEKIVFPSPGISVEIQSVVTENDQNLRDLKRQAEIPEPVRWFLWFILALLVSIVGVISWWLWRQRSKPVFAQPAMPNVDPLDLAEAELRDLLGRGLLEKGFVKQFYVELSEIVGRILEAGYGIHTMEKTTSEIMESLCNSPPSAPTAGDLEQIEAFLIECDMVKFAKYYPAEAENMAAAENAFQILAAAKK